MITFLLVLMIMSVATDDRVSSTSTASLAMGPALAWKRAFTDVLAG